MKEENTMESMMSTERRVKKLTEDIEVLNRRARTIDVIFGIIIGSLITIATVICPLMLL
jgi:hypothetical protein